MCAKHIVKDIEADIVWDYWACEFLVTYLIPIDDLIVINQSYLICLYHDKSSPM